MNKEQLFDRIVEIMQESLDYCDKPNNQSDAYCYIENLLLKNHLIKQPAKKL